MAADQTAETEGMEDGRWQMADDLICKVVGYLRQIEKLAEKGDLDGVLLEARLALRLCNAPSSSDTTADAGA